ncbi:hypothetical protein HY640_03585 [Candidatus Woesearchaeota archaeon]|nr:hypothetical protein [Candidatus Woesearchaeota archaeon]
MGAKTKAKSDSLLTLSSVAKENPLFWVFAFLLLVTAGLVAYDLNNGTALTKASTMSSVTGAFASAITGMDPYTQNRCEFTAGEFGQCTRCGYSRVYIKAPDCTIREKEGVGEREDPACKTLQWCQASPNPGFPSSTSTSDPADPDCTTEIYWECYACDYERQIIYFPDPDCDHMRYKVIATQRNERCRYMCPATGDARVGEDPEIRRERCERPGAGSDSEINREVCEDTGSGSGSATGDARVGEDNPGSGGGSGSATGDARVGEDNPGSGGGSGSCFIFGIWTVCWPFGSADSSDEVEGSGDDGSDYHGMSASSVRPATTGLTSAKCKEQIKGKTNPGRCYRENLGSLSSDGCGCDAACLTIGDCCENYCDVLAQSENQPVNRIGAQSTSQASDLERLPSNKCPGGYEKACGDNNYGNLENCQSPTYPNNAQWNDWCRNQPNAEKDDKQYCYRCKNEPTLRDIPGIAVGKPPVAYITVDGSSIAADRLYIGKKLNITTEAEDSDGDLSKIQIWVSPSNTQDWKNLEECQTQNKKIDYCSVFYTPTTLGSMVFVVNAYDSAGYKCSGNTFELPEGWNRCMALYDHFDAKIVPKQDAAAPSATVTVDKRLVSGDLYSGNGYPVEATASDPDSDITKMEIWNSSSQKQGWSLIKSCTFRSPLNALYGYRCEAAWTPPTPSEQSGESQYVVVNAFDSSGYKCTGNPFWPLPEEWVRCSEKKNDVFKAYVSAPKVGIIASTRDAGISEQAVPSGRFRGYILYASPSTVEAGKEVRVAAYASGRSLRKIELLEYMLPDTYPMTIGSCVYGEEKTGVFEPQICYASFVPQIPGTYYVYMRAYNPNEIICTGNRQEGPYACSNNGEDIVQLNVEPSPPTTGESPRTEHDFAINTQDKITAWLDNPPGNVKIGEPVTLKASVTAPEGKGTSKAEVWITKTSSPLNPQPISLPSNCQSQSNDKWCLVARTDFSALPPPSGTSVQGAWTPNEFGSYLAVVNAFSTDGKQCSGNPFISSPEWPRCGGFGRTDATTITVTPVVPTVTSPSPSPAQRGQPTAELTEAPLTGRANERLTYKAKANAGQKPDGSPKSVAVLAVWATKKVNDQGGIALPAGCMDSKAYGEWCLIGAYRAEYGGASSLGTAEITTYWTPTQEADYHIIATVQTTDESRCQGTTCGSKAYAITKVSGTVAANAVGDEFAGVGAQSVEQMSDYQRWTLTMQAFGIYPTPEYSWKAGEEIVLYNRADFISTYCSQTACIMNPPSSRELIDSVNNMDNAFMNSLFAKLNQRGYAIYEVLIPYFPAVTDTGGYRLYLRTGKNYLDPPNDQRIYSINEETLARIIEEVRTERGIITENLNSPMKMLLAATDPLFSTRTVVDYFAYGRVPSDMEVLGLALAFGQFKFKGLPGFGRSGSAFNAGSARRQAEKVIESLTDPINGKPVELSSVRSSSFIGKSELTAADLLLMRSPTITSAVMSHYGITDDTYVYALVKRIQVRGSTLDLEAIGDNPLLTGVRVIDYYTSEFPVGSPMAAIYKTRGLAELGASEPAILVSEEITTNVALGSRNQYDTIVKIRLGELNKRMGSRFYPSISPREAGLVVTPAGTWDVPVVEVKELPKGFQRIRLD